MLAQADGGRARFRGEMLESTTGSRRSRGSLVSSAVLGLALVLTGCAAEETRTYGPTTAGPTKTSGPRTSSPTEAPTSEDPALAPVRVTGAALCELFSTAEIGDVLGLAVGKVVVSKQGAYSVCTWKTTKAVNAKVPGGGIVTITRADGGRYAEYSKKITAIAQAKKARGRKVLEGVGDQAFAIGASVSGVPIWNAAVLQGGLLTGVEVSGAKSKASIATVKAFMIEILARG